MQPFARQQRRFPCENLRGWVIAPGLHLQSNHEAQLNPFGNLLPAPPAFCWQEGLDLSKPPVAESQLLDLQPTFPIPLPSRTFPSLGIDARTKNSVEKSTIANRPLYSCSLKMQERFRPTLSQITWEHRYDSPGFCPPNLLELCTSCTDACRTVKENFLFSS